MRFPDPFYLLRYYVFGHERPFLASFKLTYRCNLGCLPCPFFTMRSQELRFTQVCEMLDGLYARGSRLVVFEGGEPLLWQDGKHTIHDVVAYARRRFWSVGITTNGTLPLEVGSDVVWVSIDGFELMHDALRGQGVYQKAIANIRRSSHPRLYAHVTINARNAAETPDLLRSLNKLVRGMTVQFYYPYRGMDELFLDFDRRARLLDEVIQLKREGVKVLNSNAALKALRHNTWRCWDRLVDCANPDGRLTQGCYLKSRGDYDCRLCGFSPHTEVSLACQGHLGAIAAGRRIFFST
jgi:MoaA/NifB/PqqE/SkfB family radical SAM enzyme